MYLALVSKFSNTKNKKIRLHCLNVLFAIDMRIVPSDKTNFGTMNLLRVV